MTVEVNIMAVGGFVLAFAAFAISNYAGSDMARISGRNRGLLVGAGCLLVAALSLELHA